jgi:uncharacterized protein
MATRVLALTVACVLSVTAQTVGDYSITPVPLAAVRLLNGFWQTRLATNRDVTIPHILEQNEVTGRTANFLRVGGRVPGPFEGHRFNDTDVYRVIEAASYTLVQQKNPALEGELDRLIAAVASAQEPDGYLYPARTINPANPAPGAGPERWVHLNGSYELFNAGHLYEAAVAHFQATGKRSLLDVAIKNANLVTSVFGPKGRKAVPGHQGIELALVRLAEVTGNRSYAELARFFLEERGKPHDTQPYPEGPFAMHNVREHRQDHLPVVQQHRAVGHAVRATSMYAGMTDVAALFQPPDYRPALERLFADVIGKRMYVTGGIGIRGGMESFGDDYELPNEGASTETCAAISLEQWASRMFRLTGEAGYLDVAELVLYNGALGGVSASGDRFFYQNPLASDGKVERSAYFDVACCPANLARTLAQLPALVYATSRDTLYVNQFVSTEADIALEGQRLRVTQRTNFPVDGNIELRVEPADRSVFTLAVRIPGWARGRPVESSLYRFHQPDVPAPTLIVNGETVRVVFEQGFARVRREWRRGDVVDIHLPMPVHRVLANAYVEANHGRASFQRGPLVYAFESVDNGGNLETLRIARDAEVTTVFRQDLFGGIQTLTGAGRDSRATAPQPRPFVAIPYYAWANRGASEMRVWIPY